jgi:tetratricopeptide (TPR) repeat protein
MTSSIWLYRADSRFPAGLAEDWQPAAEEARAIAAGLGDWGRLGRLESEVAMIEVRRDPASTEEALRRAVAAAERSGNPQELAYLNQVRGRLASMAGRPAEAQGFFRAAYAQFESLGDHRFALSAQSELGHALRREGRADEAEAEYRASIRGWQRTGNRGAVANQLESFRSLPRRGATQSGGHACLERPRPCARQSGLR